MAAKETFTERDIQTLKSVASGSIGSLTREERLKLLSVINHERHALTPEQTQKGLAWLKNQAWTGTGKPRKNDPFGFRERSILLKSGAYMSLEMFLDIGIQGFTNLVPVYAVHALGSYFEYYVQGGKIVITG